MTREEAIKVLRSLYNVQRLDALTREEMTAVAMAIQSLEVDSNIVDMLFGIRNEITMLYIFSREEVVKIIDKHLKEVENNE